VKDKERLSMYVDITRITITLCWIALIAFWCLKLFGGNWFEIMVENENFIKFSDLVQNTWLKYVVSFITILTLNYFSICAICQRFYFKGKDLLILAIVLIINWALVNFVPMELSFVSSNFAYISFIVYGIIYQTKTKKLYGFLAIILDIAFSMLSMFIRNIKFEIVTDYLVLMILCIDIYIMTALYFLYSNLIKLKEENNMLITGRGWLGKAEAQERGYNSFKRFCHNVRYALSFKWAKKTK
jgi:hypothetical protein